MSALPILSRRIEVQYSRCMVEVVRWTSWKRSATRIFACPTTSNPRKAAQTSDPRRQAEYLSQSHCRVRTLRLFDFASFVSFICPHIALSSRHLTKAHKSSTSAVRLPTSGNPLSAIFPYCANSDLHVWRATVRRVQRQQPFPETRRNL